MRSMRACKQLVTIEACELSIYSERKECHERTPLELASSFSCSSRVLLATLRNGEGENKTTFLIYEILFTAGEEKEDRKRKLSQFGILHLS